MASFYPSGTHAWERRSAFGNLVAEAKALLGPDGATAASPVDQAVKPVVKDDACGHCGAREFVAEHCRYCGTKH